MTTEEKKLKKATKLMQKYQDECDDDEWEYFNGEHFINFLLENDLIKE